jgi:four helix bundle protein
MENEKVYRSFTDLDVWKAAREFKKAVSNLVKAFPDSEKYKLTDQLIRSSRSIGANISEGYGRYTYKEQIKFCMDARGSLSETLNHLIDAYDEGYISEDILGVYKKQYDALESLLNGYIAWLRRMSKQTG